MKNEEEMSVEEFMKKHKRLIEDYKKNIEPNLIDTLNKAEKFLRNSPKSESAVSELDRNNTEEDKKLAELLAGHLSVNYMNAIWHCQDLGGKCATYEDIRNMQGKYDEVRQWVIKTHEKLLTDKVLKCFRLKKLDPKEKRPNLSTALEIINYKTIGRAKKKIRKFLYE